MVQFLPETTVTSSHDYLVDHIEAKYRETPGLSLTLAQAVRFWGLTPEFCRTAFAALTARGRLRETAAGRFVDA